MKKCLSIFKNSKNQNLNNFITIGTDENEHVWWITL